MANQDPIQLDPRVGPNHPSVLEELASQQLALHLYAEAEATADQLIAAAPQWPVSYNTRGRVRIKRRRFEGAEADFRTALRLAPNEAVYLNNLGLVLHRMGKEKEAVEMFSRAAIADPSFKPARQNFSLLAPRYLWGGGLVVVASIVLHAIYVGVQGTPTAWKAAAVVGGIAAVLLLAVLLRYWLRRRALSRTSPALFEVEARRTRWRPSESTLVKAGGFCVFSTVFVTSLKLNQYFIAGIAFAFAIAWLHRGFSMWRRVTRFLNGRQQIQ